MKDDLEEHGPSTKGDPNGSGGIFIVLIMVLVLFFAFRGCSSPPNANAPVSTQTQRP